MLALVLGSQSAESGVVNEQGALAKGLLASAGTDAAPLRMLASFRRSGNDFRRMFDGGGPANIACKHEGRWTLERTSAGSRDDAGEYRQAGSAQAELMVAAQEMSACKPLDAAQERAAPAKGWQERCRGLWRETKPDPNLRSSRNS